VGVKMLRDEEWRQEDGLMLKERKVYVPQDEKLRMEVIILYHDIVRNGHPSNSGRRIPTLSQSRQRELVRVPTGFEYTTYTYST